MALYYYYECMMQDVTPEYREDPINLATFFCNLFGADECEFGSKNEPIVRIIFLVTMIPQLIIHILQIHDKVSTNQNTDSSENDSNLDLQDTD